MTYFKALSNLEDLPSLFPLMYGGLVFHIDLDSIDEGSCEILHSYLSDADELFLNQCIQAGRKKEYLVSHGVLNLLFEQLTGKMSEISIGPYGKPYAKEQTLHFNISHSHRHIVMAFSTASEIGIDIEKIIYSAELKDVMELFFHENENIFLSSLSEQDFLHHFYCLWNRKESVVKATGSSIAFLEKMHELIHVRDDHYNFIDHINGVSSPWFIEDFDYMGDFLGSIATQKKISFDYFELNVPKLFSQAVF